MRLLLNSYFKKALKKENLDGDYLKDLFDNIFKNAGVSLGAGLYKVRVARKGEGKSGGFRNIFYLKKGELIILAFLYPKNRKSNLSDNELKALKILANEYKLLSDIDIEKLIALKYLTEVKYECK